MVNGSGGSGRVEFRADERSLTPRAGVEVSGELVRRLDLVKRISEAVAVVPYAGPVKQRDRGLSVGELVVSVAESIMCGAECWDDLEELRADVASAPLRAVAAAPPTSTARQRAGLFRRSHLQAVERAVAAASARLDDHNDYDVSDAVTIDLDGTDIEVHGVKDGAERGHSGIVGYTPHIATWAERGRVLTAELFGSNRARIASSESLKLARRAIGLLPEGHGPVAFRVDTGYDGIDLMLGLRELDANFAVSMRRTTAMWRALDTIAADAWHDALDMDHAHVAEVEWAPAKWQHEPLRLIIRRVAHDAEQVLATSERARRRRTIQPGQIELAISGDLGTLYSYSFILTDLPGDCVMVEHFHRHRAQIEERIKEAKLGQALRHLPCKSRDRNRVWMTCCLLALNITSMLADMLPTDPACEHPEHGTIVPESPRDRIRHEHAPRRRTIKTIRRFILDVPGRITRTARRTIVRLPAGYRHLTTLTSTYDAILAIPPP